MSIIIGLISGLFSGVLSSIIAQLILKTQKPRLNISDSIAKKAAEEGYEYRIKVVNRTHHYVKNMIIYAQLITNINSVDGTLLKVQPISLVHKDITFIEPYNKSDDSALYAIRLRLTDNLEKLWNEDDHTYLELKIYCENESNGSGKVFKKVYNKKSIAIIEGEFKTKRSMEIAPQR